MWRFPIMKTITITVEENGDEVTRKYLYNETMESQNWEERIKDMLDTLTKLEEKKF